eukprot:CAMPEP_0198731536 /NCGR_PEP_ID=MMETSP1475-20131203/30502_1 /TAXON_ID= ORGANISM="Unidentified sp., Strain CCMP1999" /NCGR_SAMPLE_ID=MMETSP1475 /ASSEMBLY_ACC=CAM_ASM_001111 /LENGTH=381 /DNA_ID=CAMNT_0044494511 /DNA_START=197 /DNA_END=1342 /DNA_ORIENTATION=+
MEMLSHNVFASISIDPKVAKTSVVCIGQLLMTVLIAVVASLRGVFDRSATKALSGIIYNIILPCLTVTTVANAMRIGSFSAYAALPLFALAQISVGFLIGRVLIRILRLDTELDKTLATVASAFINGGTIPIFFATTLFSTDPLRVSSFIASVSLYLLGWQATFWTFGYSLLASTSVGRDAENARGLFGSLKQTSWKRVLSPPILSSIVGLLIGTVKPLSWLFLGSNAPFGILFQAMSGIGVACAPCAVLVLGGSLVSASSSGSNRAALSPTSAGLQRNEFRKKASLVVMISLVRFVLSPLLFCFLLKNPATAVIFPDDPMMRFTLLIQSVMPPAQNISLVLQLEDKQAAASKAATILLAIYIVAIVPVSIVTTLGLSWFF